MNFTVSIASIGLLLATINPALLQPPGKDSDTAATPRHTWQQIDFPTLPDPGQNLPTPHASLHNDGNRGLRLQLRTHIFAMEKTPKTPLNYDKIQARLHRSTGERVRPLKEDFRFSGELSSGLGTPYYHSWHFPWSANMQDEGWVEVQVGDLVYWLELPYGFLRNPDDPLPPSEQTRRGRPVMPATLKFGPKDRLMAWGFVRYELGMLDKENKLYLDQSNPYRPLSNVILQGVTDLHTPRTAIVIKDDESWSLDGRCLRLDLYARRAIELHGQVRSDTFVFNPINPRGRRGWGTATVTVAGKEYRCLMPTSLFAQAHGIADEHHPALVNPPGQFP